MYAFVPFSKGDTKFAKAAFLHPLSSIPLLPVSPRLPPLSPLQPAKFRQRFVIKPRTRHIICMKAIPGRVEESRTPSNSYCFSLDTSWVDSAYSTSPAQPPGQKGHSSNPFHNVRPRSCPTPRRRSMPISGSSVVEPLDTIDSPGIMSADSRGGRGVRSTNNKGGLASLRERDGVEMSQGFEVSTSTLTESSSLPKESFVTPEKGRSTRFDFTPPFSLAAKADWATLSTRESSLWNNRMS